VPCNGYPFCRTITLGSTMNSTIRIRGRSLTQRAGPRPQKPISCIDESGDVQRVLPKALELRQPYRDVFLLRDIQGHTLSEIANILRVSLNTVVARLKRARRELQRLASVEAAEGPK
jgi:RNA polymerase sigma factor (sigma-70 family)